MMKFLKQLFPNVVKNVTSLSSEFSTTPLITIKGSQQIFIENKYKIKTFTSTEIILLYKEGTIQIIGEELMITALYPEEMNLQGFIKQIQFYPSMTKEEI